MTPIEGCNLVVTSRAANCPRAVSLLTQGLLPLQGSLLKSLRAIAAGLWALQPDGQEAYDVVSLHDRRRQLALATGSPLALQRRNLSSSRRACCGRLRSAAAPLPAHPGS